MNQFEGFPRSMRFTSVPNLVFSAVFPLITDTAELKVLFFVFEILYPRKGALRFLSFSELLGHAGVVASLGDSLRESLEKILASLTQKGVLLHLELQRQGQPEHLYFLNSEANRTAISKIENKELALPDLEYKEPCIEKSPDLPDVFTLYEQNIGMLTPMIADQLRDAEKHFPESWIRDAILEAVKSNKRNWRYISFILERWSTEGKDDGTPRGNLEKDSDPDKYIRGKYGHMVQR